MSTSAKKGRILHQVSDLRNDRQESELIS